MMIMEASKSSLPNEFGAFLRAENGVIYEIAMLPGTIQGKTHTSFILYNRPIDFQIVGSVHSHPSGNTRPSDADISMFSNTGQIHIITGYPYRLTDFSAYNRKSEKIDLRILGKQGV
ncbi:MAG: Mov34/MPN/PAD-1 family protein [Candidatus Thermoplasmatota archaeon]|jgi:proteasome lid subunit RPN8/RPN11|nr:Mov34/MPN/PAD-1 family protein [Candidatus Thermoplasmatota archaeon]